MELGFEGEVEPASDSGFDAASNPGLQDEGPDLEADVAASVPERNEAAGARSLQVAALGVELG